MSTLVLQHLHIPRACVFRFAQRVPEAQRAKDDLLQAGREALVRAARAFAGRSAFATMAWTAVRRAVVRCWLELIGEGVTSCPGRRPAQLVPLLEVHAVDQPTPEEHASSRSLAAQLVHWATRNVSARDAEVYMGWLEGESFGELGAAYGISKQRAVQVAQAVTAGFRAELT